MAIRSGFFNSVNGDRKYDASRFAEYFNSFIGNGIFPNPSNNLQVVSNGDMTVTVKAGKAWINGYFLVNDDDYMLEIDVADGVLSRIDRIVARYDAVDREIRLEVKKGAFASNPVVPNLQRDADAYELGIADIKINKGATSITQVNITDLRKDKELCGLVDSLIAGDVGALAKALDEHKADIAIHIRKESGTWIDKSTAIAKGGEYVKTIPLSFHATHGKLMVNTETSRGGIIFFTTNPSQTMSLKENSAAIFGEGLVSVGKTNAGQRFYITSVYIDGNNLIIKINNDLPYDGTLLINLLYWEVEEY